MILAVRLLGFLAEISYSTIEWFGDNSWVSTSTFRWSVDCGLLDCCVTAVRCCSRRYVALVTANWPLLKRKDAAVSSLIFLAAASSASLC